MNTRLRIALICFAAFVAGVAGVFAGRHLAARQEPPASALHQLLHEKLALDQTQEKKLALIETHYAAQRRAVEQDMRIDNARLAAAIVAEHGYGPQVSAAIDRTHAAMGELQKLTLAHVFAMRQLLRPDQAKRFDAAVVKALTAGEP